MSDIRAGIYTRISLATLGDMTKTDDQERICRNLAAQLRWQIADGTGYPEPDGVYCDHSKSAWQKNRKRPAWNRMLEDVDAGKINAIIVYHGDRLVRRPEDLAELMKLADSKGVKLASPTGTKDLDTERLELWIRAAFAEEESQRTSERRKSQYERWRREGRVRPGGRGGRAYGFETDGVTQIPAEAQRIRQAASMILAGDGVGVVARWLNESGGRTPTGIEFGHATVRKMLARPRYAGLMPDGVSPAAWKPVLDRETWEAVCSVLETRGASFSNATNARKYLLSGIAKCGQPGCGKPMQIWQSKGRTGTYMLGYRCSGCRKLFRSQPHLDAYVTGAVLRRLSHDANPSPRTPELPGLAAEFQSLTDARAETAMAVEDPANPHLPLLLTRLERIDKRLAQLREMAGESARDRLVREHAGISREEFEGLPLGKRRALVAACFEITVLPSSRRGPGFRTEDVRITAL